MSEDRSGAGNRRARKERGYEMLPDGRCLAKWYDGPHYIRRVFRNKAEAKLARESVRVKKAEGRYIIRQKEVSFEKAVERFLEWGEINTRPGTFRNDKLNAPLWLASPHFAGKTLDKITAGDVELFRAARLKAPAWRPAKARRGLLELAARLHRARLNHTLKGAPRVAVEEATGALLEKYPPARIEEALSWWYGRPGILEFSSLERDLGERAKANPAGIQGRPLTKRTADISLARLKRLFSLCLDWGLCDRNPAARVKLFREDNKRTRYLTEEEEARLMAVCSPALRRLVTFALHTGMRRGEIMGLRWRDVDFPNTVATIPGTRAKGRRDRYIPLNAVAVEILKALPGYAEREQTGTEAPRPRLVLVEKLPPGKASKKAKKEAKGTGRDALVFCNSDGGEWDKQRAEWIKAVSLAGLVDFRFHDLRHTYASRLVMQGVDLAVLRELLGHRDFEMTLRYAHLAPSRLKEAVSRLAPSREPNQHLINTSPESGDEIHRPAAGDSP